MTSLEVFDPAMCCSTGVCGPSVDPALATFAADLDWLAAQDVAVRRYNLGQEPGAFACNDTVRALLHDPGETALPVVVVDGAVRSTGRYPTRDELAAWAEVTVAATVPAAVIAELAAIGAAVGSNCEPCFKYHYDQARKLGLTKAELVGAVRAAQAVKDTPAGMLLDLAGKLLGVERSVLTAGFPAPAETPPVDTAGGCCGSDTADDTAAPAETGAETGCCGSAEPVQLTAGPTTADPGPTGRCC